MIWRAIIGSKLARAIGGTLVAVLAVLGYGAAQRRKGAQAAKNEGLRDAVDRIEKGSQAVRDGRGDDPADRLRRNDGKW